MTIHDSLGDRMKNYEDIWRQNLPKRMPVIIRLDGKAFHTYTKNLEKPFSQPMMAAMNQVALSVMDEVQGATFGYTQSDEISILVLNNQKLDSEAWFGNNIQKMVSVAASVASVEMTLLSPTIFNGSTRPALFDARAFVLPPEEVCNYFLWRQRDWNRNSIQMLARSMFSQKELQGKKTNDLHEMCWRAGQNWGNLHSHIKAGRMLQWHEARLAVDGEVLESPSDGALARGDRGRASHILSAGNYELQPIVWVPAIRGVQPAANSNTLDIPGSIQIRDTTPDFSSMQDDFEKMLHPWEESLDT